MSRRIIALNNNGVDSLCCGRYEDAIFSFRHAIECVKNMVDSECQTDHYHFVDNRVLSRSPLNSLDSFSATDMSPNNMFNVYQGAFYLPKARFVDPSVPEMSVVLLYNLALAHHLAGLVGMDNFNVHFRESLLYYKLALEADRSHPESKVTRISLVLGCVTNMGHIYAHFWRVQEAKSCGQILDRMLESPAIQFVSVEDGEFFFATMTHFSAQTCDLAPAA